MSLCSQAEFRLLYTNDPRYRYELRTRNAPSWPHAPAHPRLVYEVPPTLYADGTYGDRDFLFAPVPFDRRRVWIHYIPQVGMWRRKIHGHHFEQPPIFIKPTETDTRFWCPSPDGTQGKITSELYNDLRTFWISGISHAQKLLVNAREYADIPVDPAQAQWEGLHEITPFSTMIWRVVELQRQLGELYGWIMLQEKLQACADSIVPDRPGLRPQHTLSPLDFFTGVIVPWDDRSPDFDSMALEHGVCLWWCDYAPPGSSEMPAWRGLGLGKQAVSMHRGTGYIAVDKEPGTRKFLVEAKDSSGSSGHFECKRPAAEAPASNPGPRRRPTALSLSDPPPHPRAGPSTSSGSHTEGRKPIAEMSPEELAVFWAESAARRAAHELAGTAKTHKGKKPKKNREERRQGRIVRGEEP
ncbi:hypothetical protein BOTBODRAFT_174009 [Botryobasidium botryosum FD-172 SS1]|uniref:Uncharacterized protein n=1 Tax=Botryobasidium botryosum (strain FD-172 SS1) TaxID=930990 RepID=A0A067MJ12_BOTB1|nr:hypothetical protein BOTBODRAFT_174009 [Botryobasidium botryosum FD-172 SS1]